jgi:hypothetical protein
MPSQATHQANTTTLEQALDVYRLHNKRLHLFAAEWRGATVLTPAIDLESFGVLQSRRNFENAQPHAYGTG